MHHVHAWCLQTRKGCWIPWDWSYSWLWVTVCILGLESRVLWQRHLCSYLLNQYSSPILKSYRLLVTVVAPYLSFDLHRLRDRSVDRWKLRESCIFLADLFALLVRYAEYLTCTLQHPSMCSTTVYCSLVLGHPVGRNKCEKAEKSRDCAILIN